MLFIEKSEFMGDAGRKKSKKGKNGFLNFCL